MRKQENYATAEQTDIKFDLELKWKTPDKRRPNHSRIAHETWTVASRGTMGKQDPAGTVEGTFWELKH